MVSLLSMLHSKCFIKSIYVADITNNKLSLSVSIVLFSSFLLLRFHWPHFWPSSLSGSISASMPRECCGGIGGQLPLLLRILVNHFSFTLILTSAPIAFTLLLTLWSEHPNSHWFKIFPWVTAFCSIIRYQCRQPSPNYSSRSWQSSNSLRWNCNWHHPSSVDWDHSYDWCHHRFTNRITWFGLDICMT